MHFLHISADRLSSGTLNLVLHVWVVLNVPAIVLKTVKLDLSVSRSCMNLDNTIDTLAPKSNSVLKASFFLNQA